MRGIKRQWFGYAVALGFAAAGATAAETDLEKVFRSPPATARPWVYWWWLNSNVTREGITRDLEEMNRQGIQGVLLFNAGGADTPKGPEFMGPEWMGLYRFTLKECARLGMEVSVNLCDGWDAGGPWIPAEAANKKLVWSEWQVDGPRAVTQKLPQPPTVDGFYRDVAVVALQEQGTPPVRPAEVRSSSSVEGYCGEWNWPPDDAADADPKTTWRAMHAPTLDHPAWIDYIYSEPLAATTVYVAGAEGGGPGKCQLQSSVDGKAFAKVVDFELAAGEAKRIEFPETKAVAFRLVIQTAHMPNVDLAEMWLLRQGDEPATRPGIKWWWFKSGNRSFWDWPPRGPVVMEEEYPADATQDCAESVDLSAKMKPDGTLEWQAPAGRWTVLRFGYTLEGQRTRCASTVIGYESDMLDAKGIETHFEKCAKPLLDAAGELTGKTLKYLHVDSYELGADIRGQQPTWSADFVKEFQTRRGYDPRPYLPAMARRIVGSREKTDRFLWDVRMTIGDLFAERFFKRFAELAHARGVGIHAETGYGTYPHPHFDGLRVAGQCDVTMGEFWTGTDLMSQFEPFCNVIRAVASPAHIYGKRIVQAESFTSWNHFREYPAGLKALGDRAFCDGLNRIVFHQYTHQPNEDQPGWQYGAGTHVDRHVTWWGMSAAWMSYLARCQYFLQNGRFHADVCYFEGEGSAKYAPGKPYLRPELPAGYNYDCINAEVLTNRISVQDGRLAIPDGPSYRLLVLSTQQQTMSPGLLKRIQDLIAAGATVLGDRPTRAPGLSDWPKGDAELKRLADEMWGPNPGSSGERQLGKGKLIWGRPTAEVLAGLKTPQDFEVVGDNDGFEFIHRVVDGADVYFVSNQAQAPVTVDCTFRVSGRRPELWDPVDGSMRALPEYAPTTDQRTRIPMRFEPCQSCFVVFRKAADGGAGPVSGRNFFAAKAVAELAGPWTVAFDPKWGGPQQATFEKLVDWTQRPEAGIKYYSGTATYRKTFDVENDRVQGPGFGVQEGLVVAPNGKRVFVDLGAVDYIARVRLNGKDLGVVWTAPWRVDVTGLLKVKGNQIEIEVANTWVNRLVGDATLPAEKRFCRSNIGYPAKSPLMPSGLLGPVTIRVESDAAAEPVNLACGRPTVESSSIENGGWTRAKLVDGEYHAGWSSSRGADRADHAAQPEFVSVKLRRPVAIDRVVLHPRDDVPWAGQGFPEDFSIQVSNDGQAWKTVVEKKGYPAPQGAAAQVFELGGVIGRYVKVEATRLRAVDNAYYFQLAELEVFGKEPQNP